MARKRAGKPGRRYPLLLYQRLGDMLRLSALLLVFAVLLLWLLSPRVAWLATTPGWMYALNLGWLRITGDLLLLLLGLSLLLYAATVFLPMLAFVQCYPNYLMVRTPLVGFVLSYKRIMQVNPVRFVDFYPLIDLNFSQRRFIKPVLYQLADSEGTAIQVDVANFPKSMRWMRRLIHPFMFNPKQRGLLLLTTDWMVLGREIEGYRMAWRQRRIRKQQTQPNSPYLSITSRDR